MAARGGRGGGGGQDQTERSRGQLVQGLLGSDREFGF